MQVIQKEQGTRINAVEYWQMMRDAHEAAMKDVRSEEETRRFNTLRDGEAKKRTDLYGKAIYVLGLLGVALYAYLATKGIR